jgi:hypothetical protein
MPGTHAIPDLASIERLRADAASMAVATHWLWQAAAAVNEAVFLRDAVNALLKITRAEHAAVVTVDAGRLHLLAEAGSKQTVPLDIAAEALDREAPVVQGPWSAVPLQRVDVQTRVLIARASPGGNLVSPGNATFLLWPRRFPMLLNRFTSGSGRRVARSGWRKSCELPPPGTRRTRWSHC